MALEQKVLLTPTFINGSLQPAGAIVSVDTEQFKPAPEADEEPDTDNRTPNLADIGQAPVLVPTPVAAIMPTGPNPTAPQQVPPGSLQTNAGYANGGALLVAEGHPDLKEMVEGAEKLNAGIEEEQIKRLNAISQNTSTTPVDGTAFDGDGDGRVGGSKAKARK